MKAAMWAYPWDLLDEGVNTVADQLGAMGVTEINLATNYHSVQTFLPHNPERRTFFAHASSYFHPGEDYDDVAPIPNETMGDNDWLEQIVEQIQDTHLSLNSWTVGCHNSRLGMKRPDLTLESPYGDPLVFGLCPSNPAVQAYLRNLVADLDSRAPFERIELETFDYFYGTGFGWHHEKYHTRLGALGEFLFGLCFCDHCRSNAADAGIDVASARETCRTTIDAIADGNFDSERSVKEWLADHPMVADYIDVRTSTLTSVFRLLESAVTDAELGYYVGFFGVERSWMHGADLDALADFVDYYTVVAYESSRDTAVEQYQTATDLAGGASIHAGVLPGHPAVHDEETNSEIVRGLADAGAPRLSFYNYGLLPERNLTWIANALEPYSR
ncbi:hypothetical protein [Haladaptatus halobius]|uniref:hypothetical protein n=1 Tax=Haladaptatus halobius TaxID=2884875 RepID=UPI001D0BDECE|nr:hypothetical protein [Haladaptatus halobius]